MDRDFWQEIWLTITQQKTRSIMTAFGVFWGILILTILVGAGIGFSTGMELLFSDLPANSLITLPNTTTLAWGGLEGGRKLSYEYDLITEVRKQFGHCLKDYSMLNIANRPDGSPHQVSWGINSANYSVAGVSPSFIKMIPHKVVEGRYIDDMDQSAYRKVCVIGINIQKALFDGRDPIGEQISIDDIRYTVVGVCKNTNQYVSIGVDLSESVILPISTQQLAYGQFNKIDLISFVFDDENPASSLQDSLNTVIMEYLKIHPDDKEAITTINLSDQLKSIGTMKSSINLLVWIVGLGTLLAGLIGISNIIMVTVSERTQEIGVRRALGARPYDVMKQILCESMVLTMVSGVIGLSLGVWILYFVDVFVQKMELDSSSSMFANPHIPINIAAVSLLILVIGGLAAGWIPARRALQIKAIDALREE